MKNKHQINKMKFMKKIKIKMNMKQMMKQTKLKANDSYLIE